MFFGLKVDFSNLPFYPIIPISCLNIPLFLLSLLSPLPFPCNTDRRERIEEERQEKKKFLNLTPLTFVSSLTKIINNLLPTPPRWQQTSIIHWMTKNHAPHLLAIGHSLKLLPLVWDDILFWGPEGNWGNDQVLGMLAVICCPASVWWGSARLTWSPDWYCDVKWSS